MDSNLILLGIALLNAYTAWMAYRTHSLTEKVEVATNSMKDQLVAATGKSEYARGKSDQQATDKKEK